MNVYRQFAIRSCGLVRMGQDVPDVAASREGSAAVGDDDTINGLVELKNPITLESVSKRSQYLRRRRILAGSESVRRLNHKR